MGDFYSSILSSFEKRFKDNAPNKGVVMEEQHWVIENANDYWMFLWGGKFEVQSL